MGNSLPPKTAQILDNLVILGEKLVRICKGEGVTPAEKNFHRLITNLESYNPWFIPEFTLEAVRGMVRMLDRDVLTRWIGRYTDKLSEEHAAVTVAVINAGNIPGVGFHDFISVLISGHYYLGKLSHSDDKLLPAIGELLIETDSSMEGMFRFTTGKVSGFDAVIATGSDNTARYFDYYFGRYPNIIRRNRNGVAVLTGRESDDDLKGLARDIFLYFGMGCRNVAKLYVPGNYDFDRFFSLTGDFAFVANHHKYRNNYDYYKSIYLINKVPHLDNGYLLLAEESRFSSPPGVVFYETYREVDDVLNSLKVHSGSIQCVTGPAGISEMLIPFGTTQLPAPWDYPDGIDTMEFLLKLGING
ncbi:MAG: acyl-CoA reductase [Bacteroidales bacterium]